MASSRSRSGTASRQAARGRQRHTTASDQFASVEAVAVSGAVVVGALGMWRGTGDQFGLLRTTLLIAIALYLVGTWIVEGVNERRAPTLHDRQLGVAAGAVLALMVLATVTAPYGWRALWGADGRWNGLLLYSACAVLFIAAAQLREREWAWLARLVGVLLGLAALYGVLQWLGADPFDWPNVGIDPVFSTFGQPNFAAGWVAVGLPFAGFLVVERLQERWQRYAALVGLALGLLFLGVVASFQGIPAGFIGILPLAFLVGRDRTTSLENRGQLLRRIGGALALLVLLLVAVPTSRNAFWNNIDSGLRERSMLWEAGIEMVGDSPLLGHGMASFGVEFAEHRPTRHAAEFGNLSADAPHSVPLEMATNGGILLVVAYLAFVVLIGIRFARGLRRSPTPLLAAVGGAWLAYQVQGAVSFDVPPLVSMHWILAGGILALTSGGDDRIPSLRAMKASSAALVAGGVLVMVLSPWWSAPFRADRSMQVARDTFRRGDLAGAIASGEDAVRTTPWRGRLWADMANLYQRGGNLGLAINAGERAVAVSGSGTYRLALAQLIAASGDNKRAALQFQAAIDGDPRNWTVYVAAGDWGAGAGAPEAAGWYERAVDLRGAFDSSLMERATVFLIAEGEADRAVELVEDVRRRSDPNAQLEVYLARASNAAGELDKARDAYSRALEIDPSLATARDELAALP
jgi:O-antigen ligase